MMGQIKVPSCFIAIFKVYNCIEFVTSEDAVASSLNAEVDALVANQAQAARVQEIQDGLDAMAAGGGKKGSRAVRDSSGKIRVVGGL